MPHRAESSNQFERARGMAGSGPTALPSSSGTPFQAPIVPPTTAATSSPPYPRTLNGALCIESSYDNHHHHQPMPWFQQYDSVHRVEPSPSGPGSNGYSRLHESSLTPREHYSRSHTKNFPQPNKSASVDSAEAAAASALLLASTEINREVYNRDASASDAAPDVRECTEGNVPLKKRKKHLDFMRRNQGVYETSRVSQSGQPCHISPVSSSSVGSALNADEQHPEETLSVSSKEALVTKLDLATSRADSYDMKEAQALPETAKINDSTDIRSSPSSSVQVGPHFPTILHNALTQPEFASVLQWLSHGEAWKVLRWDALRREVLPQFFPHLREDEAKGYGSIDAFLLQVRAWGFEEITDGPDVGAYRHAMFLREQPSLCQSMHQSLDGTSSRENDSPPHHQAAGNGNTASSPLVAPMHATAQSVSPTATASAGATAQSILRVPSLRAKADGSAAPKFSVSPITRPRADANKSCNVETPSGEHRGVHNDHKILLSPPPTWPPSHPSECAPPSHTYRPDESMATYADSWLPHPSGSSFLTRTPTSASCLPPNFDLRFSFRASFSAAESGYQQHQQHQQRSNRFQYGSPQVRSGRGALRVATRNRGSHQYEQQQQPNRPGAAAAAAGTSYPVSHRGRGSSACRIPLPPADLSPVLHAVQTEPNDSRFGPSDAGNTTRFSNSDVDGRLRGTNLLDASTARKCKRKLPLARKSSLPTAETVAEP